MITDERIPLSVLQLQRQACEEILRKSVILRQNYSSLIEFRLNKLMRLDCLKSYVRLRFLTEISP